VEVPSPGEMGGREKKGKNEGKCPDVLYIKKKMRACAHAQHEEGFLRQLLKQKEKGGTKVCHPKFGKEKEAVSIAGNKPHLILAYLAVGERGEGGGREKHKKKNKRDHR